MLLFASGAQAGVPQTLEGRWDLDLEASGDPTPLLDALEAGFIVRRAAHSVRPTHVIAVNEGGFDIKVKTLLMTNRRTVVLDGATATDDDFFGHAVTYTSRVEGERVVSTGTIDLGARGRVPLTMERFIDAQGRMCLDIIVTTPGSGRLVASRVFTRTR